MIDNVVSILDRYGIEYVDSGPNVKKGNINIACPFCGDDPSHHLGIDLQTNAWGCWRDNRHRGRKIGWLLAALLKIPLINAKEMAGENAEPIVDASRFNEAIAALKATAVKQDKSVVNGKKIALPKACMEISKGNELSERALDYLVGRGFKRKQVYEIVKQFNLEFCAYGDYKDRIIVPVYQHAVLNTFVGRSIYKNAVLRYKAQPAAQAVRHVKECVYNVDAIRKRAAKRVYIVEGPFDVIKLDYFAASRKEAVVGLFSKSLESEQAGVLAECCENVKEVVLLLDAHETASSLEMAPQLRAATRKQIVVMECSKFGSDDPGSLSEFQAVKLLNSRNNL